MAVMATLTRPDVGSLSGAQHHLGDGRGAAVHDMLLWKLQTFDERKRPTKQTYTRMENSSNKSRSDSHLTTQGYAWSMHTI